MVGAYGLRRFFMTSIASGLSSMRTHERPCRRAASPVVPLPAKKSSTQSPGLVWTWMMRSRMVRGFWVGYQVFSRPTVLTMVFHQTSVGVFPMAAFVAPTMPGAM